MKKNQYIQKIVTIAVVLRDIYLHFFRHAIIVNGYVDDHTWKGIRHRNWGDDLNYYFLRELTRRPVVFYHNYKLAKWLHLKNYLCIGTLLDAVNYANAQTIVWGSGVSGKERSFVQPESILAVRGPNTKEFCDRYGVSCLEVYGDPALLLPLVYKASPPALPHREGASKKYRLGIIPHVVDLHYPVVEEIRKNHANEILIIDLAHYKNWTDVIDQICSCEKILSSSLHGLIVSDAYQVSNCWIELSGKISGGYFKFIDYASSVSRNFEKPIHIEKYADITDLVNHADLQFSYAKPEKIKDLQNGLINVAPFKLKGIQSKHIVGKG